MNYILKIFAVCALNFFACSMYGQTLEEERGDTHLETFEFEKAIDKYMEAFEKEPENPVLTRKIADAYRRKGDLGSSAEWYKKTLDMDDSRKEDLLYYAEALKTQKKYDESLIWYEKYNSVEPDQRAENHLENDAYYEELTEDSVMFVVKSLDFNNKKPAFGVTKHKGKLLFSAAGIDGYKANSTNPWNDQPYLDVFQGTIDQFNEVIDIEPINPINSKYNDGPAHYSEVLNTIFVTRNNMKRGKPVKDKTGSVNLKIYASNYVDGKWSDMYELPFNSDDYSTGHPAVTKDGKIMYFSSNRPGGSGGTDIYYTERINDTWSIPQNLGEAVNTRGDEMFPYVDENNVLYFSSTGHVGLGGLDLFKINLDSIRVHQPENLGYPLNSSKDDFSLMFQETDRSGYFCSNRDKGYSDNIYYFEINNLLEKIYAGRIESSLPDKSLAGTELIVRNLNTHEEVRLILDEKGEFEFDAIPGTTYELAYVKEDVEEILTTKTVEDVIADEYENLGIFTIHERLAVNVYDEGGKIQVNDVLYKRFDQEGMFISEQGDTLSDTEMMDLLSRNMQGNDMTFNNQIYKVDIDSGVYKNENGEDLSDDDLEKMIIGEILANPLDIDDGSALAGVDAKLGDISEAEYLELQANSPEGSASLTEPEQIALGLLSSSAPEDIVMDYAHSSSPDIIPLEVSNPEEYAITSKEELKVALSTRNLENIYFDFDKSNIRPDAKETLDEVAAILLSNSGLEMYINAHTDSRGSNAYNDALSERRAASVKAYLKARGVNPERLELNWFGEDRLTNQCADDADCGENAHQLNRRAAFALAGDVSIPPKSNETPKREPQPANTEDETAYDLKPGNSDEELASAEGLEMIYFDYDKSSIRNDAQIILDAVVESMNSNDKSVVINAHTDSRGSNDYNASLSKRRAESTLDYLQSKGISVDRIEINWSGETQLANSCENGIQCNANEHQMNRRASLIWK